MSNIHYVGERDSKLPCDMMLDPTLTTKAHLSVDECQIVLLKENATKDILLCIITNLFCRVAVLFTFPSTMYE